MKKLLVTAIAALAMASSQAQAQIPIDLGLRAGVAIPFGDADSAGGRLTKMSDQVSWGIPIQAEAAYRITPQISAGVYLTYAPYLSVPTKAFAGSCTNGVTCSGSLWRFGIEGFYRFALPGAGYVPWAGLGIGKEWATLDASYQGGSATGKASGWEYFNLQGGLEWKVYPGLAVGPFAIFSVASYGETELAQTGAQTISYTLSSAESKYHYWLTFGVKGTYSL